MREWASLHVYFAGNPVPLMKNCISPIVRRLLDSGAVDRFFFINYWLQGSHVRLRLRGSFSGELLDAEENVAAEIAEYLRAHPSYHPFDIDGIAKRYDELFRAEFTEADRPHYFDAEGLPIFQPNNSVRSVPYTPEVDRYGGPKGMDLAEKHFEFSSRLIMNLIDDGNTTVRTLSLGIAMQLMLAAARAFLVERRAVQAFMDRYYRQWNSVYTPAAGFDDPARREEFASVQTSVIGAYERIDRAFQAGTPNLLPGYLGEWSAHMAQIRQAIVRLAENGDMRFAAKWGGREDEPVAPGTALRLLLNSFVHMTNNRLGILVTDEAYLALQASRALQ